MLPIIPDCVTELRLVRLLNVMEKKYGKFEIDWASIEAVIFDMDGVVTQTAKTHAAAWKKLFDAYLRDLDKKKGTAFRPFSIENDYRLYVDGKPRYEGVKSFLESRGLKLPPWGDPGDPPERETICGIGNRKNELFHGILKKEGAEVYRSTVDLIHTLKKRGVRTAVVTSSKNCEAVLEAARIRDLFDAKVDGKDAERLNLEGKPNPDIFLRAAGDLGVDPKRAVVVEDAIAGVQAGKNGNFGVVIGVDRNGHSDGLIENGADITVKDLSEIAPE
jgi:beta-phosphoglucomutase family hydrolase